MSETEHTLLEQSLKALKETTGLEAQLVSTEPRAGDDGARPDALIRLSSGGRGPKFYAFVRRRLTNDILGYEISRVREMGPRRGVLVTSHVSPPQAEKLRSAGAQFLDTAGNAYLDDPPLYVFVTGRHRHPPGPPEGVRTTRAFTSTWVKAVFALLCKPGLVNGTYREIAAAADVALGKVGEVLTDLKRAGCMVEKGDGARRLLKRKELIERWVEAYAERLRPKLRLGRYSGERADWWEEARPEAEGGCWGGEVAAAKLTGYLRPEVKTIYAPTKLARLQVKFHLKPDALGDTEILKKFWDLGSEPPWPDTAPALLVYADLIASGDDRNIETAKIIYDRYLDRPLGED
jgi:hypothetical protein